MDLVRVVKEDANDSARVSEQDRKIPPALGTNEIARFGGFCPELQAWKKIKMLIKDISHMKNCTDLNLWRGVFVHIYLLSFPRFSTLIYERL